jgi:hypothetical protein
VAASAFTVPLAGVSGLLTSSVFDIPAGLSSVAVTLDSMPLAVAGMQVSLRWELSFDGGVTWPAANADPRGGGCTGWSGAALQGRAMSYVGSIGDQAWPAHKARCVLNITGGLLTSTAHITVA